MARGARTVYPGERNKGLSSTFQLPEEGRSVQRPKRCDKHGNKDEDNSPKNVNNTSSQKYRQNTIIPYNLHKRQYIFPVMNNSFYCSIMRWAIGLFEWFL